MSIFRAATPIFQRAATTFGKRMPYVTVGVGGYMLGQETTNRARNEQMKQMLESMAQQNYQQNMPMQAQPVQMPEGLTYYQNGMPQPMGQVEIENHYYSRPKRKRRKPSREEIEAYLAEQEEGGY
jgi:hypothetical protein